MQVITVSDNVSTSNMIRGAFATRKLPGIHFIHAHDREEMLEALNEHSVVLVDWEGETGTRADLVSATKAKLVQVTVLLLCAKSRAGSVFAGIKAGAAGVINKPFDTDDVIRSIASTLRTGQKSRPTVNVEFINPFIDATRNVLSSMCRVEIERKKIFVKDDYKMLGDISGVMRLSGTASVTMDFSGKSILPPLDFPESC